MMLGAVEAAIVGGWGAASRGTAAAAAAAAAAPTDARVSGHAARVGQREGRTPILLQVIPYV